MSATRDLGPRRAVTGEELEQLGWSCETVDGRVRWAPPAWLDPDRRPRVNTLHERRPGNPGSRELLLSSPCE